MTIVEKTIREQFEEMEKQTLSPFATLSVNSKGRRVPEDECDLRTLFQRDRDRILHSKAFRRLRNKTQVFLSPKGDHYRTRLSHTLEVAQNARTIAKALRLNEELSEAIALGHDLGHTPYGHAGESALNSISTCGFDHSAQSVRVCEYLEKDGRGLNLTFEVLDGIRNHQTEGMPATPEGQIVRLADKIAYICSDIDDALRAGILMENDIPKDCNKVLGSTFRERVNTLIHDCIITSQDSPIIHLSEEKQEAFVNLRKFLFSNVYANNIAKDEEVKAKRMLTLLYDYYNDNPGELPEKFYNNILEGKDDKARVICDYISGMTDSYANRKFMEIFVPVSWEGFE